MLVIVAVAVWVLAMIIPAGQYDMKDGSPVPGTYHEVPSPMDFHERVNDLLLSPVNGLYGIQDSETGVVVSGSGRRAVRRRPGVPVRAGDRRPSSR